MRSLTLLELRRDLTVKCSKFYFTKTLGVTDKTVFQRRSFRNLFHFYRNKGITELQLMKALILEGFYAQICNVGREPKVMFAKVNADPRGIWATPIPKGYSKNVRIDDKYTAEYIENLFKQAKKEIENGRAIY